MSIFKISWWPWINLFYILYRTSLSHICVFVEQKLSLLSGKKLIFRTPFLDGTLLVLELREGMKFYPIFFKSLGHNQSLLLRIPLTTIDLTCTWFFPCFKHKNLMIFWTSFENWHVSNVVVWNCELLIYSFGFRTWKWARTWARYWNVKFSLYGWVFQLHVPCYLLFKYDLLLELAYYCIGECVLYRTRPNINKLLIFYLQVNYIYVCMTWKSSGEVISSTIFTAWDPKPY